MFEAEVIIDFFYPDDNDDIGLVHQSRFTIVAPTVSSLANGVARAVLNQTRLSFVGGVKVVCKEE